MSLDGIFNITAYGACVGDNTPCTAAFTKAIAACATQGGGTVLVPPGVFHTGPIRLETNITLHLSPGARLVFVNDLTAYPPVLSRWEGVNREVYCPMIFADHADNVAVTGNGTLDGQGAFWWREKELGTLAYPRSRFLCFQYGKNVRVEGVTFVNSPAWTVNPIACEDVFIRGIRIQNPANSPNTDGINPESCRNVHISDCHIDVGDDCITLKSGTEDCSERLPCENVTITNCTMVHGHGGVVIGSEMSGDVRNVVISNCVFQGTDRGLRIKSRRGRGGVVERVRMNNVVMEDVLCPFVMNLYYFCGPRGRNEDVQDPTWHAPNSGTPAIRDIHVSNVSAARVRTAAAFLHGLPESPITDISFSGVSVEMASGAPMDLPAMMCNLDPMSGRGFIAKHTEDIRISDVRVKGCIGEAFEFQK